MAITCPGDIELGDGAFVEELVAVLIRHYGKFIGLANFRVFLIVDMEDIHCTGAHAKVTPYPKLDSFGLTIYPMNLLSDFGPRWLEELPHTILHELQHVRMGPVMDVAGPENFQEDSGGELILEQYVDRTAKVFLEWLPPCEEFEELLLELSGQ